MREIKFKFWNRELRIMSKPHGLGVIWEYLCEEWGIFDWKNIEKLQFTGLHDRNGKEIYEGDIIGNDVFKWVVYFGENQDYPDCWGWSVKSLNTNHTYFMDYSILKGRVIGNIHENGNLLEKN